MSMAKAIRLSLVIDTGGEEPSCICSAGSFAKTLQPLIERAFRPAFSSNFTIDDLNNLPAAGFVRYAEAARHYLSQRDNFADIIGVKPNPWAEMESLTDFLTTLSESVELAISALDDLTDACRKHPKATICVAE
jgi:hypothetical protein